MQIIFRKIKKFCNPAKPFSNTIKKFLKGFHKAWKFIVLRNLGSLNVRQQFVQPNVATLLIRNFNKYSD